MTVMKYKYWYIKERHNPQLGIYYIKLGNISAREASQYGDSLYGNNYILKFESESEYNKKCIEYNAR